MGIKVWIPFSFLNYEKKKENIYKISTTSLRKKEAAVVNGYASFFFYKINLFRNKRIKPSF